MSNERRDRRLRENERESRTHRSSSHRHRSNETHKHDHDRRHRRHRHRRRIPHPEMEPRSSTHIYFNGSASNVPSVSVHTDHVTLASSLNSFNEGMDTLLDNCFELLGRLRKNPIVYSGNSQQTSSNGKRGVNHSNLAAVPTSQKTKTSEVNLIVRYRTNLYSAMSRRDFPRLLRKPLNYELKIKLI